MQISIQNNRVGHGQLMFRNLMVMRVNQQRRCLRSPPRPQDLGRYRSGGINEDISYAALRRNAADLKARKSRIKDIFSVEGLDKCEAMDESRRIDRKAFAAKHFDISEGGLFTKKDDVTTLLRWSSKPLKKPLLRAVHESKNKKAYEDSCQYMRNIQGYMLDRKSGKSRSIMFERFARQH